MFKRMHIRGWREIYERNCMGKRDLREEVLKERKTGNIREKIN